MRGGHKKGEEKKKYRSVTETGDELKARQTRTSGKVDTLSHAACIRCVASIIHFQKAFLPTMYNVVHTFSEYMYWNFFCIVCFVA